VRATAGFTRSGFITSEARVSTTADPFDRLAREYLDASLELHPTQATALGCHDFDGTLEDLSPAGIRRAIATYHEYQRRLEEEIDPAALDLSRRIDHELLLHDIRSSLFDLEELQPHRRDPKIYNDILGYSTLFLTLLPEGAPEWPARLDSLRSRLLAFPDLLATARANLENPSPVLVDYVIEGNQANVQFLQDRAPLLFQRDPGRAADLEAARVTALRAVQDYQRWLEQDLRPDARGEWRLGRSAWEHKLRLTLQSELGPDEIERRALQRLQEERESMLEIAEDLHGRLFPGHVHRESGDARTGIVVGEVIRKISERHSTATSLLSDVGRWIDKIKEFLRRIDFITLPPEDDVLAVEPTPGFLGGLAVAFFNPPPAFEPWLKKSFWISSVDGKPPEFIESYLREYNDYALQSLTIHEAFPGHYVQFWHALNSPVASLYKKIYSSSTFAEGWAVLTERLLFEAGFGHDEPENLLIHKKIHLRSPINALLDQRFHTTTTEEMSDQELEAWAMDLMCRQGYQEVAEARGKVRRAKVSSTQLSTYFVGYLELDAIHKRARQRAGDGFRPREFHDKLLSYGTLPPPQVARLLEEEGFL
jgi:uncharacterized protein (DUF885 family)